MGIAASHAGLSLYSHCIAHTLTLAYTKALDFPRVRNVQSKVRKVVTFFHKSNKASNLLSAKKFLLASFNIAKTRWNSTFNMIERYLEQQTPIYAALTSPEGMKNNRVVSLLVESEITDLEYLKEVLKPLKDATSVLCDEKMPKRSDRRLIKDVLTVMPKDFAKREQIYTTANEHGLTA